MRCGTLYFFYTSNTSKGRLKAKSRSSLSINRCCSCFGKKSNKFSSFRQCSICLLFRRVAGVGGAVSDARLSGATVWVTDLRLRVGAFHVPAPCPPSINVTQYTHYDLIQPKSSRRMQNRFRQNMENSPQNIRVDLRIYFTVCRVCASAGKSSEFVDGSPCSFVAVIDMAFMVYFVFFGCVLTPLVAMFAVYGYIYS